MRPGIEVEDTVTVNAPRERVWEAIDDPKLHATWHPFLKRIEGTHRLNAVRNCEVLVGNKAGTTRERCVENDAGHRITWLIEEDSTGFSRMVSDFRAGFTLSDAGMDKTIVTARSTFVPRKVFVRIMAPMIRGKFSKTHEAILKGLKEFAESSGRK